VNDHKLDKLGFLFEDYKHTPKSKGKAKHKAALKNESVAKRRAVHKQTLAKEKYEYLANV